MRWITWLRRLGVCSLVFFRSTVIFIAWHDIQSLVCSRHCPWGLLLAVGGVALSEAFSHTANVFCQTILLLIMGYYSQLLWVSWGNMDRTKLSNLRNPASQSWVFNRGLCIIMESPVSHCWASSRVQLHPSILLFGVLFSFCLHSCSALILFLSCFLTV